MTKIKPQFEMGGLPFNLAIQSGSDGERLAREAATRQRDLERSRARQGKFFEDELTAGTLQGAVLQNPAAAVRELGPLEVMRIGCGTGRGRA